MLAVVVLPVRCRAVGTDFEDHHDLLHERSHRKELQGLCLLNSAFLGRCGSCDHRMRAWSLRDSDWTTLGAMSGYLVQHFLQQAGDKVAAQIFVSSGGEEVSFEEVM